MRTVGSTGTKTVDTSVDALYRLHAAEALRVARLITCDPDDAADAVAEAFAGVLQAVARDRLSGPEAFRPYLLAATRNASIDVVRRSGRLRPTDHSEVLDGASPGLGPCDRLVAGEDRALVAEAFSELPPRWRAVLWLTEVEELAPRDAALLLQVTPNNVAQLAVRARSRLRQRYVQLHVRNHAAGDCLETTEHLAGLLGGDLTTVQETRVRGHLAECAMCRARLAELEDLGLSLRRAAMPLPLVLWVRSMRRRLTGWRSRSGDAFRGRTAATRLAGADPSATAAISTLASSPAIQQVGATVVAGLLVLGVGAAVVRNDDARPRDERRPPVEAGNPGAGRQEVAALAAPPAPTPATVPSPETSTTNSTTTNTVPDTSAPPPAPTTVVAAPPFTPRGRLASAPASFVAHAIGPELAIYDGPDGPPRRALANPQSSGAPLVLLVTEQRGDWLQVLLPVRPNGSTGWIRSRDVTVVTHNYRIVVELGAHRITAYEGTAVLLSEPIGVGTADAPTPGGLYYIKELFQPVDNAGRYNPGGPYGPYAYGLSGFSEVLFEFGGGDGQFGIHGTNDPGGLGFDVSAGCIRMSNAGVTYLAGTLPLGVPVDILP